MLSLVVGKDSTLTFFLNDSELWSQVTSTCAPYFEFYAYHKLKEKLNPVAFVRERQPLAGEVSAKFCG
jgi:hypothetical protein